MRLYLRSRYITGSLHWVTYTHGCLPFGCGLPVCGHSAIYALRLTRCGSVTMVLPTYRLLHTHALPVVTVYTFTVLQFTRSVHVTLIFGCGWFGSTGLPHCLRIPACWLRTFTHFTHGYLPVYRLVWFAVVVRAVTTACWILPLHGCAALVRTLPPFYCHRLHYVHTLPVGLLPVGCVCSRWIGLL